jgi:hypothetical protein
MSAFVIDADCMDRAINALCARTQHGPILPTFAGVHTQSSDGPTAIGRKLFVMNVAAVLDRYADQQSGEYAWVMTYRAKGGSPAPASFAELAAGLKALHCLKYQASEGDIPQAPIFKELEIAIGTIADAAMGLSPDYARAPWG